MDKRSYIRIFIKISTNQLLHSNAYTINQGLSLIVTSKAFYIYGTSNYIQRKKESFPMRYLGIIIFINASPQVSITDQQIIRQNAKQHSRIQPNNKDSIHYKRKIENIFGKHQIFFPLLHHAEKDSTFGLKLYPQQCEEDQNIINTLINMKWQQFHDCEGERSSLQTLLRAFQWIFRLMNPIILKRRSTEPFLGKLKAVLFQRLH